MRYGDRICDIVQYMKRETIIGTVIVCGLIGVVNYIVHIVCNQTDDTDNHDTEQDTNREMDNQYSIVERVNHPYYAYPKK